ncbi:Kinesin-like protein KIF22 [Termitomyces sp. T112]|nr:Kinesin-like protein KIF22 [Termitomyces sp. T112]
MASAKIKIIARLRPRLNAELDDGSVKVIHSSDDTGSSSGSVISVTNPRDPSQVFKFPFSSCYDETSTQEEIFQNDVQPMIDVVYSGVTVTIFAYGVTSSGKTHTMQGSKSEPGVIPRTIQAMFDKKEMISGYNVSLFVSYMEIYKDEVYDLLVTRENAPKLPVRENDAGMVFVANLTSEPISTVEEFDIIYNRATKHRSVGSTNLNHASSRSHAVLTIEAKLYDPVENKILTGKINLVDLAGSENNKLTGNDHSRMAESAAINKSLSVLGQVVHALNSSAVSLHS